MKVGLSLLTLDKLDWTKECFRTLRKYTGSDLYDLCVLDNGSRQDTIDFLVQQDCHLITHPENIGVPKARNIIFKHFILRHDVDYVCIIHNDMIFTPDWLEKLLEVHLAWPKKNIIGCSAIIGVEVLSLFDEEKEKYIAQFVNNKTSTGNFEPKLFPINFFHDVGFYDEDYGKQECEDVDLNYRAYVKGWDVLGTNKVAIYHAYALTRLYLPDANQYIGKNQYIFAKKWPGVNLKEHNIFTRTPKTIDGRTLTYNHV